jgi:hypothetical protein
MSGDVERAHARTKKVMDSPAMREFMETGNVAALEMLLNLHFFEALREERERAKSRKPLSPKGND